jgi:hypothetical protein
LLSPGQSADAPGGHGPTPRDAEPHRAPEPEKGETVDENDHPKGALLFMLVYLTLLALMWTNMYFKLWKG